MGINGSRVDSQWREGAYSLMPLGTLNCTLVEESDAIQDLSSGPAGIGLVRVSRNLVVILLVLPVETRLYILNQTRQKNIA